MQDSDVLLGTRFAFDVVALVKDRQIGEGFRRDRDAIAAYYKAGEPALQPTARVSSCETFEECGAPRLKRERWPDRTPDDARIQLWLRRSGWLAFSIPCPRVPTLGV